MKPTEEQIQEQIDLATENEGKFSGMTYEEGVRCALQWALGISEDAPME